MADRCALVTLSKVIGCAAEDGALPGGWTSTRTRRPMSRPVRVRRADRASKVCCDMRDSFRQAEGGLRVPRTPSEGRCQPLAFSRSGPGALPLREKARAQRGGLTPHRARLSSIAGHRRLAKGSQRPGTPSPSSRRRPPSCDMPACTRGPLRSPERLDGFQNWSEIPRTGRLEASTERANEHATEHAPASARAINRALLSRPQPLRSTGSGLDSPAS